MRGNPEAVDEYAAVADRSSTVVLTDEAIGNTIMPSVLQS
jgi:hypothetical protein